MAIKTFEMDITPEQASEWMLRHNEKLEAGKFRQRWLRRRFIIKYASDMRAGAWLLTPDAITFDEDNNLLNGQHRLEAIIMSGCTVRMMISTGWPKGNQSDALKLGIMDVLDEGVPRRIPDKLHLHGMTSATFRAAVVNSVVRCCYSGSNMPTSYASTVYILKDLDIGRHLEALEAQGASVHLTGRLYGPVTFYRTVHAKKADEFMRQYLNMDFEKNTGPWLLARYANEKTRTHKSGDQKTYIEAVASCLRLWDEERTAAHLRLGGGSSIAWLADKNEKLVATIVALCGKREK